MKIERFRLAGDRSDRGLYAGTIWVYASLVRPVTPAHHFASRRMRHHHREDLQQPVALFPKLITGDGCPGGLHGVWRTSSYTRVSWQQGAELMVLAQWRLALVSVIK